MHRAVCSALLLVSLSLGCQLSSERLPIQPLPENGQALNYAEVHLRLRLQATGATEAFYVNKWNDLQDAARALDQSARLLVKATEVPERHKAKLVAHSDELVRELAQLLQAAKAQDVERSNASLQRLHLKVRELRPEN
jgi:hypothetical protein